MRLNRFLSVTGAASRRKGETIIRAGRVRINNVVITDPAYPVDPDNDSVTLDGKVLAICEARRYIVLNKPDGYIVSRGDTHGRATIYHLIDKKYRDLFPVGRLDADTTGVLLLTDDGDMAHRLMHPSWEIDKIYRAKVAGSVSDDELKTLRTGVKLEDGITSPATVRVISRHAASTTLEMTIHEGKKRQVRRMCSAVGHNVIHLERISFCGITLRNLDQGKYRALKDDEVRSLRDAVFSDTQKGDS